MFEGVLEDRNGKKMPAIIATKAWQSGTDVLPEELEPTAKDKVLNAILALTRQRGSIVEEELNKEIETKGNLRIFSCSPPVCWKPSSTVIVLIKGKEG